jgi:hypothetical protein
MKTTQTTLIRAALWTPLLIFLPSCESGTKTYESGAVTVTGGLIPDLVRARNERLRGPLSESEWNRLKVWKKIKANPPTYIPKEYSASSPRSDADGRWFEDERDGKRLFVPYAAQGGYSPSALAGDSRKIVNWRYSKGENWYDSVYHHVD